MPYQGSDIDRAIVMTQYDLRGFAHPTGLRLKSPDSKSLYLILTNFFICAAGSQDADTRDPSYVSAFAHKASYAKVRHMCERILEDGGDESRKEAIWLISKEIRRQHGSLSAGKDKRSGYLHPLTKRGW